MAGLKNYKTNFREGEMGSFAGVVSECITRIDRTDAAPWFSPPRAGEREFLSRGRDLSALGALSARVGGFDRWPLR